MDVENARRNLRDFLTMYNQFTETCFERCVQNLNYRILTPQEESCTNKCVSKLVNVNHRQISVYMAINPLNRRLNELSTGTDESELHNPPTNIAEEVEKALGRDASASGDSAKAANVSTSAESNDSPGISATPVTDVSGDSKSHEGTIIEKT